MGPSIDRIRGAGMECMVERMDSGMERMGPLGLYHMASSIEHMGQTTERFGSVVERMGASMGFGLECMATLID
ncbi:Heterogeneous nuclear ribonucleoprotein M [Camelus dromedarius]|uniref:Heterogeneous nuclear ribonucleoprotein M n=1 Tax=Camelus dromedarius TaxID=9838 RepID=A0A5N4C5L7_CAMDR|nr:Heterogeneous nuclear ribonucleoprotein M [Camelus dromedarius]